MRDTSIVSKGMTRRQALRDMGAVSLGLGALGGGLEGLLARAARRSRT